MTQSPTHHWDEAERLLEAADKARGLLEWPKAAALAALAQAHATLAVAEVTAYAASPSRLAMPIPHPTV